MKASVISRVFGIPGKQNGCGFKKLSAGVPPGLTICEENCDDVSSSSHAKNAAQQDCHYFQKDSVFLGVDYHYHAFQTRAVQTVLKRHLGDMHHLCFLQRSLDGNWHALPSSFIRALFHSSASSKRCCCNIAYLIFFFSSRRARSRL